MNIASRIEKLTQELPSEVSLVAVSKFHPAEAIQEAYDAGQRIFGESRVQELVGKYEALPKDIRWHFIGHLQQNKVKYIAPFIDLIHSVDSLSLLQEIDRQAARNNRLIRVLLQIHIAREEHKFGFSYQDLDELLSKDIFTSFPNIVFSGLMGMATFTDDEEQIDREFAGLKDCFDQLRAGYFQGRPDFCELSMGMTDDYPIALKNGSTMIRIGSMLFGSR